MLLNALTGFGASSPVSIVETNLVLHLDAADAASWDDGVDSQRFRDMAGGGYDFFRGSDGTVQAADPTFNGSVGGKSSSEYFSFDGSDYFKYDSANEAWMNGLHKNNAKWTLEAWIYFGNVATDQDLMGATSGFSTEGIRFQVNTSAHPQIIVSNASGSAWGLNTNDASITITQSAWHQLALSFDEGGGASGSFFVYDGAQGTAFDGSVSSPSASNAGDIYHIASNRIGFAALTNNSRLAIFRAYDTNLSLAQLQQNWSVNRGRFGL